LCWNLGNQATTGVKIQTGGALKAEECVENAISRLKHQELAGTTQQGRHGLGWWSHRSFGPKHRRERERPW